MTKLICSASLICEIDKHEKRRKRGLVKQCYHAENVLNVLLFASFFSLGRKRQGHHEQDCPLRHRKNSWKVNK